MDYVLLICSDGDVSEHERAVMGERVNAWIDETTASGARRFGHALDPVATAKTVRSRDGETLVSDGPFVDSKEFIGGFDLIEAADLDAALQIAAAHPMAHFHAIEVRARHQLELDPEQFPNLAGCGTMSLAPLLDAPRPGTERYLLFFCVNGIPESDAEEEQIARDGEAWAGDLTARGIHRFGSPLAHANTATTVRVRNGETLLTDGPFTEAKEFIAGFSVLDTADEQEAIAHAAAHPLTRYHRTEVRRFADVDTGCG